MKSVKDGVKCDVNVANNAAYTLRTTTVLVALAKNTHKIHFISTFLIVIYNQKFSFRVNSDANAKYYFSFLVAVQINLCRKKVLFCFITFTFVLTVRMTVWSNS